MCLFPGTLSREVSRPNEVARRRASWVRVMSWLLVGLAGLRILSFSVWAALADAFAALYGLSMLRANFGDEDRIVLIESVLIYALIIAFLTPIDVLTLLSITTRSQMLQENLVEWQSIVGIVVCGVALAVYVFLGLSIWLLYRALKQTVIVSADETNSFLAGEGESRPLGQPHSGPGRGSNNNSSFFGALQGISALGRVSSSNASASAPASASGASSSTERFPGKAYRLDV